MEEILYQGPNWVDQLGVVVMATVLAASEILVVMIAVWALFELGLSIYERLRGRVMRLSI